MHRQAIQAFLHGNGVLKADETIERLRSEVKTILESRAYTPEQVDAICTRQREDHALATRIAYAAGLRAHELLTLLPLSERPAEVRYYIDGTPKALPTKWQGREGAPFSVVGKGGLVREVRIPKALAACLEAKRLAEPRTVVDRAITYQTHYDVQGGHRWSDSFSEASKRMLGWSTGAHGLRHAYAQERMEELAFLCSYEVALETVSQEMGHFGVEITEVYLR